MSDLRFDGQVAIVTGAGGNPGLGRSYARLLAVRGAKVVVNDLGVGPDGRSTVPAKAAAVAEEIRQAGGEAVADANSVATQQGAQAIVETALETYGRVDILINNAGVVEFALFEDLSSKDIQRVIDTHVWGHIWMCKAAWPHMKAAGYGRIINTASGSMLGARYASVYGTAKSAVLGLTRNLAIEGAELGIKVNAIWPFAATNAWQIMSAEEARPSAEVMARMSPDLSAPVVAFLAHANCPASGKCIVAEGKNVYELWYARTAGVDIADLTLEQIERNWQQIVAHERHKDIADPFDGCAGFTLTPRSYKPT